MPYFKSYDSIVFDGRSHIYLIGSYLPTPDRPVRAVSEWNVDTFEHKLIPVDNFPFNGESDYFYYPPATVFVPKLNRIYHFGGTYQPTGGGNPVYLSSIWYLDLNELNTTTAKPTTQSTELPQTNQETTQTERTTAALTTSTTETATPLPDLVTCHNKTEGWHPHPYDCAMYIGCQANGDMLLLRCPEPLLFDPGAITCRPPQQVNCATTCVGKPNGVHPHPQDCSLFITCVNEELAVSGCQIPLLFDPALLQCNLPESVTC